MRKLARAAQRRFWPATVPHVYGHSIEFDKRDVAINLWPLNKRAATGEAAFIERSIRPGHAAIDAGANIGLLTLLMARATGPAGWVFAFEPGPRSYRLLAKNIAANGYRNVIAENMALGNDNADSELQVCPTGESDNRLSGVRANADYTRVPIKVTSLDSYLAGRRVDFIKIDTQGSEYRILQGARQTISASQNIQLIIEYAPSWLDAAGVKQSDYFSLIESLGLSMFVLPEHGPETPTTATELASAGKQI